MTFLSFFWYIVIFNLTFLGENQLIRGQYSSNETTSCSNIDSYSRSSRKKRSLTFPQGSAFVLTMSLVKAIQLKEPANWNLDLEFDVVWPIPNGVVHAPLRRTGWTRLPPPHRRHRRELYSNFALALDSQGLPGKRCILRTICETKFALNPPGVSIVEDLIRVVFSYPAVAGALRHDAYDVARMAEEDCAVVYPCPFSFLSLLLHYDENFDESVMYK